MMPKKSRLITIASLAALIGLVLIATSLVLRPKGEAALPTLFVLPSLTPSEQGVVAVQPSETAAPAPTSVTNTAVSPTATAVPTALPAEPATSTNTPSPVPVVPTTQPLVVPIPQQPVPNQVVIRFDPNATQQQRAAYIQSIGGTVEQNIDALDTVVVSVPAGTTPLPPAQAAIAVATEPDYFVVALQDPPTNDPLYPQQWALPAIGVPNAWASMPTNAPTIIVAVIDSGICAEHPDLKDRIVAGWDFLEYDAVPQDDFGHGCAVSGIIAANANDGIGMAGVAPNTTIMPLRVLNAQGIGTYSNVAAAITYAADHNAQIINLSLGGTNQSTLLQDAIDYAISKNVIVIAAAGNTGGSVLYPAAYPPVIAVASVDQNLERSSFSSYGPEIDLLAPGRDILTTKRDGTHTTMSGTSFAAPNVAGAQALAMALGRTLALNGGIVSFGGTPNVVLTVTPTSLPEQTATPVETVSAPPITITNWQTYNDTVYGYSLEFPASWQVLPTSAERIGGVATFSDPSTDAQIVVGVEIYDRPASVSLTDWVTPNSDLAPFLSDQAIVNFSQSIGIEQTYNRGDWTGRIIYIPFGSKVIFTQLIPDDNRYRDTLIYISNSIVYPIQAASAQLETPRLYPEVMPLPADQASSAAVNFILPFSGKAKITQTGDGGFTHKCSGSFTWDCQALDFDISINGMDGRVYAAEAGNVVFHGWDPNGYGNLVKIQHSNGWVSWYAHLSSFQPPFSPSSVRRGQWLGIEGNTGGTSTGTHLHFAIKAGSSNTSTPVNISNGLLPGLVFTPCTTSIDCGWGYGGPSLYRGSGLTDWSQVFAYSDPSLVDEFIGNDSTASVRVPEGWTLILYSDVDYGGTPVEYSVPFTGNVNIAVSSLKVGYLSCPAELIASQGCLSPTTTSDTTPPSGSWSSPSNGATISSGTVTLSVNASDNSGGSGVHEVRFSALWNGQWQGIGTDSSAPYSINWDMCSAGVPDGDVELGMEVWDNAGNVWIYSQHFTNIHITKNYNCNDGGNPQPGGAWNVNWWMNRYLAGFVNWEGTVLWDNGNYPYIYFDWGSSGPVSGWGGNEFSGRLWRNVYFPGGHYDFYLDHDDGARLYVDGQLLIDVWWDGRNGGATSRDLSAGYHEVKVEYYENQADAFLRAWWYGPGYPRPDENPPDGRITSPSDQAATNNTTLSIWAEASDDASGVNRVEFYAWYCDPSCTGWKYLGTAYSAPYRFDWNWSALQDDRVLLKIDIYDNTNKKRSDAGGFVNVWLDRGKPIANITSPLDNAFLTTSQIPIQVTASDALSGASKVQFFAGYSDVGGAAAQALPDLLSPSLPNDLEVFPAEATPNVSAQGWSWQEIGWDNNGSDGWSFNWDATGVPDQQGVAFFVYVYDRAGNYQGAVRWGNTLDRTPPSSAVGSLPATSTTPFTVSWTGSDATSGIASYDVQYQDNGGAWTNWQTNVTTTSASFNGVAGHTYSFRSRARDHAGNLEAWPVSADTQTTVVVPLSPPTLMNPAEDAFLRSRTVSFSWQSPNSPGQTGYTLRLSQSDNPDTSPWLVHTTLGSTALTYANTFTSDGVFYWNMRTNTSSSASEWVTRSFTIDTIPPTGSVISPLANSYLNADFIAITGSASDGGSGVQCAQFFVGYDPALNGQSLEASSIVNPPEPASSRDDILASGTTEVGAQGWGWQEIGWDCDGSDGWSQNRDAQDIADQNIAVWIYFYDLAWNYVGASNGNILLDRTAPTSAVNPLTSSNSTSFNVSWSGTDATSGIAYYDIQYQDNSGNWTDWQTNVTITSATFTGVTGHTYGFRSRALDLAGNEEAWPSTADTSTVVTVSAPTNDLFVNAQAVNSVPFTYTQDINGATISITDPGMCVYSRVNTVWFSYTSAIKQTINFNTEGSGYDTVIGVYAGNEANLTQLACDDDSGTGVMSSTTLTVNAATTYHIMVAKYGSTPTTSTTMLTFSVVSTAVPPAPILASPANGIFTNETIPTFMWNAATNAYIYQLQIDNAATFTSPEQDIVVSGLGHTANTLSNGLYYWRVRAFNSLNMPGAWSAARSFTIDTTAPLTPVLTAPVNGFSSTNNRPTFTWKAVAGASRYEVQLDTTNPPSVIVTSTTALSYVPPSPLLLTTYNWRVRAKDTAGNFSPWSETRSIVITSPANSSPSRNRFDTSTPTLTWGAVTWATGYEIQVDNNQNFSSPEYVNNTIPGSMLSDTTTILPNGTWYWRARARRSDGTWGPWSPVDNFIVDVF